MYQEVTLDEVKSILGTDKPDDKVYADTETVGFYGRIRLAQIYREDLDKVLLVEWPDPMLLAIMLGNYRTVWHNAHYDITTIQQQSSTRWIPACFDDTFYLSRLHFYKKDKFALDDVMTYVLGYDPYARAKLNKKELQKSNWDAPVLTAEQKLYAAIDVFYLPAVFNAVKDQIDTTSYSLDMLNVGYALDFQNNGFPVDKGELDKQYANNLALIKEQNLTINANSWKQVRPYIGSTMSDKEGLIRLTLQGNEKAAQVNIVRMLLKQNSFLAKFDTNDGRIYGKFQPSARSGRYTCKDQNLEQLPRKTKHVFGLSTDSGRVLIYSDYAQLEIRCICCITGEPRMEQLLKDFEDLHMFTAKLLFGGDPSDEQRRVAKTANFSLLYGAGWKQFIVMLLKQAEILLPDTEAKRTKNKWLRIWVTIDKWQQEGMTAWRHGEAWSTPFGRRYTAKLITDQLNIKNQGFGAEVAKLAMHYIMPKLEAYKDTFMVNFIHDSYIIETENDPAVYEPVAQLVANMMQEAWFEALRVGTGLKIRDLPMPVDVFVGYNWGRIEDDYLYKYQLKGMEAHERI